MSESAEKTAKGAEQLIYSLYKFLWIIVLIPKEAQFAVFAGIIIWWTVTRRQFIRVNKATVWFLVYAGIHLMSIIIAVITRDYALTRIAAAFNTCGIWVLAVWITGVIQQAEDIDSDRIGRYCVINIGIMFAVMLLTWQLRDFKLNMIIESRVAWTWDLLSSGETTRFSGLLEYPTLVGVFVLLQYPWAFRYLSGSKYKWSSFILIPVSILPVFMTYARMGTFLVFIMIFVSVNYFILKQGVSIKRLLMIYGFLMLAALVVVVIKFDTIATLAEAIFNARPGSNADRLRIYTETANKISETSWLIGAGVKEMNPAGVYPLGSHCTYLGLIYKAGILGTICVAIGFILTIITLAKKSIRSKDLFAIMFCAMLAFLLLFFVVEDIDGANWLIVMVFTSCMAYNISVSIKTKAI